MRRNQDAAGLRFSGRRVLLLGLGRFGGGIAATCFLLQEGARVRVADRAGTETLSASVAAVGSHPRLEWCLGRDDVDLLDGVELLVANPAVPDDNPILTAARQQGIPVTQEINLFLDAYPGQVVLVTGTNGKSTTTTLLAAALRNGRRSVLMGGNIGTSLLTQRRRWRQDQIAVVEISSFQLERIDLQRHRVRGSVLTRITEDHLDRHGTLAAYQAAKARAATVAEGFLVHAHDDVVAQQMTSGATQRLTYGLHSLDTWFARQGGWLWSRHPEDPGPIAHPDALELTGLFQQENVLAAAAAAAALGVDRHGAAYRICRVRPLPHRLQLLHSHNEVRIYDNSISTQLESTLAALASVPGRVHWVGGGRNKGSDIHRFIPELRDGLASAHLFGTIANDMVSALSDQNPKLPTSCHDRLDAALDAAMAEARAGDAILFSPAFSSHDQFVNFEVRAARFHDWVQRRLPSAPPHTGGKPQPG